MKRLLVGSVFAPTPRNAVWYDLQIRFLRKTLGDDFDHVVFANRVETSLFTRSAVIGTVAPDVPYDDDELEAAMVVLLEYFASRPDYEHYLILDSDAFPFRPNWLSELLDIMQAVPEMGLPRRRIAAPVRGENLDAFPHACVFFIDGDFLRSLESPKLIRLITKPCINFAGFTTLDLIFDDAAVRMPDGGQLWCPLIRTNTWNPHPIVAAVYGHMFYHHGAGSRSPAFRILQTGLAKHYLSDEQHVALEDNLFAMLSRDPEGLCAMLAASSQASIERTAARSFHRLIDSLASKLKNASYS